MEVIVSMARMRFLSACFQNTYAADGLSNQEIVVRLDTTRPIVRKWRKRSFEEGVDGLKERHRSRRPTVPPRPSPRSRSLACELPHQHGLPLSRLSLAEIGREAIERRDDQLVELVKGKWPDAKAQIRQ
jgi:hypothetical protein